jgi:ABC-2 type transport system permease protein
MLLWTASVLSVFAAVNVLFNRAILSWVERWMAQRRTREVLAMLFMLLMTCTQFIYPISMRWATRRWRVARGLQPLSYALPPGWGGRALAAAVAGNSLQAGSWLAVLTASGFILAWLLTIRLKRQYRGEDLGEARAATAVPRSRAGRGRWELGEFSGPVAAVFQKEILYLLRNWPMLLGLFSPLLILIYFGFSATGSARSGLFVRGPDLLFPLGAGFAALTLFAGAYNSLGFDGAGVQLYLVAPITFRDVLVGKNLAQAFTLLAEMSLVWVGVSILFGPPGGAVVGTTLAGLAFVALMTYTVGNPLSLCFPRRLQFGSMRAQQASGLAALASVGAQFLLVGIVATVYLLARHWGRLWLAAVLFLLLCVPATLAYLGTLNLSNRMAMSRRTVLTEELCH